MPSSEHDRGIIITRGEQIVELPREEQRLRYTDGTKRSFRGTKEEIEAKRDELEAAGWQCVIREGPVYSLDANFGALLNEQDDSLNLTKTPRAQWEVVTNKANKDILESKIDLVDGLDPLHIQSLRAWMQSASSNTAPALDYYLGKGYEKWENATGDEATEYDTQYYKALDLYKLIANGVKDVEVKQFVLRKVIQVPVGYPVDRFTADDRQLFSYATLVTDEDVPEWMQLIIPSNTDADLSDNVAGASNSTVWIKRHYGYVKNVVSASETTEGRVTVTIEYTWGIWAESLYGEPL